MITTTTPRKTERSKFETYLWLTLLFPLHLFAWLLMLPVSLLLLRSTPGRIQDANLAHPLMIVCFFVWAAATVVIAPIILVFAPG